MHSPGRRAYDLFNSMFAFPNGIDLTRFVYYTPPILSTYRTKVGRGAKVMMCTRINVYFTERVTHIERNGSMHIMHSSTPSICKELRVLVHDASELQHSVANVRNRARDTACMTLHTI